MDYPIKFKEHTIGFMLIVFSTADTYINSQVFAYKKNDKEILTDIEGWEKHFEEEKSKLLKYGVVHTSSIKIIQNIYYDNISTPSVLTLTKEELQNLLA